MTVAIDWKVGFEIELMAPRGSTRLALAQRVSGRIQGSVSRYFQQDSEHSAVPGRPVFENLTLAFRVDDSAGNWAASFVDDLTLQADCDHGAAPMDGWYRIVGDDGRLLRLAARHCDAEQDLSKVLDPFAELFGTAPSAHEAGMIRVVDSQDMSLAIGAPLPGERERPCEIVTAPIAHNHAEQLTALLDDAKSLGFIVPVEGATHLHFDAAKLCNTHFISRFVPIVLRHGHALRQLVGVNPSCVRIGGWPDAVSALVETPEFLAMSWEDACGALAMTKLTKYCDFNLVNMVKGFADKHTLEVRILPSHMEADAIVMATALFEGLIRFALGDDDYAQLHSAARLIEAMPLTGTAREYWVKRLAHLPGPA